MDSWLTVRHAFKEWFLRLLAEILHEDIVSEWLQSTTVSSSLERQQEIVDRSTITGVYCWSLWMFWRLKFQNYLHHSEMNLNIERQIVRLKYNLNVVKSLRKSHFTNLRHESHRHFNHFSWTEISWCQDVLSEIGIELILRQLVLTSS